MELGFVVSSTTSQRSPEERLSKLLSLDWVPAGFEHQLRKESGWSQDDVTAAIAEYARFIHLAASEPGGATPSRVIDAVWHLHLLSREYWTSLCAETLGRPLYHNPGWLETGDPVDFQQRYAETLAAYERWFGAPAPARFWPRPTPAASPEHRPEPAGETGLIRALGRIFGWSRSMEQTA